MPIEDINEPDIYVLLQLGTQGKAICLIVKNTDSPWEFVSFWVIFI